ncbi:MAG TPA: hypothetical protein ACFYDZ_10225, partial [Candidatus Brocadiaceae bacterium]
EIGNYVKYLDEILHKCNKGIDYCKLCPNELICAELEKDDFGLIGHTLSDILTAIHYALDKIPGYLDISKRSELKSDIQRYIQETSANEREMWENKLIHELLDNKLANPSFKPPPKIGEIRTLLTYDSTISFSLPVTCLIIKNKDIFTRSDTTEISHEAITLNSFHAVNQCLRENHINVATHPARDQARCYLEMNTPEILHKCNLNDLGLAAALCYYSLITQSPVPGNIAVTGGLDNLGKILPADFLDSKTETIFRELHFIDTIITAGNPSLHFPLPKDKNIFHVNGLGQAISIVYKRG